MPQVFAFFARHPRWKWAAIGVLSLLVPLLLIVVGGAIWYTPQLPSLAPVTTYQPRQPLQVFTVEGQEIAQFGTERRQFVPIQAIPPLMQNAVLAVEDARFRSHFGIDVIGVARALVSNLTGGRRQGASTITQQVARNFFLSSRLTFERKFKEALLALQIERQLSKDQILELYMNQIYLGQRAYGFASAAEVYFGKSLAELSVAEAAMLAGLPQNPSYANPLTNLDRAVQRQRVVLARMAATGVITPEQLATARAQVLQLRGGGRQGVHAEHVAEMARRAVVDRFGTEAYSQGLKVYTSLRAVDQQAAWAAVRKGVLAYDARQPWRGPEDNETLPPTANAAELERAAAAALKDCRDDDELRVAVVLKVSSPREMLVQLATGEQITLKGDALKVAQAGLSAKATPELAVRAGSVVRVVQQPAAKAGAAPSWAVTQWPDVQAALVSLDAATGRVRALVGGFDFNRQPFNHVTQAWRQPGSSFKPFLYSAAMENGVTPATLVNDAPFIGADGWEPQNSDGQFDGPITLRQALARSKNMVSIRVLQQVGISTALSWVGQFGFDKARQPDNLTLALGAGSTTPMQLAQGYAVLANGGWAVQPVVIERITDAKGKVLFEAAAPAAQADEQRVVPARNVFITNSLLNDVTRVGTAARAQQRLGRPDLYGKTGTTNDAVDAWFAGFQTSINPKATASNALAGTVAVVWMGYDTPQSLGQRESGGGVSLPIWIDYMAQALKGVPVGLSPVPPEGIERVGDDWLYSEWVGGGQVTSIGLGAAAADGAASQPLAPASAPPGPAASGPAAPH
jgi:penicillin-binding protein 1A